MIEYLCLLRNDIAFHTFIFLTNTFLISFNAYQIWLLNHSFVYRIFFNSIRFNLFTFTKKLPWVWVQRTIVFNWQISSHPNILILIKWWGFLFKKFFFKWSSCPIQAFTTKGRLLGTLTRKRRLILNTRYRDERTYHCRWLFGIIIRTLLGWKHVMSCTHVCEYAN